MFGRCFPALFALCAVVRVSTVPLSAPAGNPLRRELEQIAQVEGLNGQPKARYLRLVQDCKNSMRAVLQKIDAGEMMDDTR